MRFTLVFITLALPTLSFSQVPVERIKIETTKTQPEVIRALLDTREGATFDPKTWQEDLQRIKNSELFYDIEERVTQKNGKKQISLKLKNKFSTIPIFKFKRGGGTSQIIVGLYEVNFLNRLMEAGGQFERMKGKNGAVTWFRHPYFLSRRNKFGSEIYLHTINLPLLTKKGDPEAHIDNKEIKWNARIEHEYHPKIKATLETSLYRNSFEMDNNGPGFAARNAQFLSANPLNNGRTVSLTPQLALGRLDYDRFLISGNVVSLQSEWADKALGSEFEFTKTQVTATGGWIAHPRWNLAYHAKLGTKTGNEFQHKFYLGGLDTVRGFLDGQFRGEHMWLVNLEARPTLLENNRWILQGNLFSDIGKTWDARNFGNEGFSNANISLGAGIRVILPKIYRAVIRLDVASTQEPIRKFGFNFGLQQFF